MQYEPELAHWCTRRGFQILMSLVDDDLHGLGARQLERIGVVPDQASAGLQAFQDRFCVSTAAEGAVNCDVAGGGPEKAKHFRHHDRAMRAGRHG